MSTQNSGCFGANAISTPTYKQQAYDLIKDAILYRRLTVDTVYSQDGICSELGISRTPVREALLELQKEGYISFLRGRGIKVNPVSRKDAEEIVEMREIVELAGSRLAALRASDEQLAEILKQLEEMRRGMGVHDDTMMYKLDRKFHIAVFEAAGNRHLLETVESLRDQFLRVEALDAFRTEEKCRQVLEEHTRIYEAIAARDPEKASAAMQAHLHFTYDRTVKFVLETNTV